MINLMQGDCLEVLKSLDDNSVGSGSTGKAAKAEGLVFIGIGLDPEYFAIAQARIEGASQ